MKKEPNSNSKDRISGDASNDEDILNLDLFDDDQTSDFSDLEEDIMQLSKDSDPLSGGAGRVGASEDDVIDLFEEDNAIDDDDLIDLTKEFEEFLLEDDAEAENDEQRNAISFPEEDIDDSAADMDLLELTDEVDVMSADTKDAAALQGASGNADEDDGLTDWANEINFSLDDNDEEPPELDDEAVKPLEDEEEPLELTDEVEGPLEDEEEPLELTDEVEGPLEDDEEPLELTDEVEGPLEDEEEPLELTDEVEGPLEDEEEPLELTDEVEGPLEDEEEPLELTDEVEGPLEDEEEPLELTDEVEGPLEDEEEPLELTDEVEGPLEDEEEPLELTDEAEGPLQDEEDLLVLTGEPDAHADKTGEESRAPADDVALPEEEDEETPLEQAVFAEGIVLDTEIVDSETSSEEAEVAFTTPEMDGIDFPFEQEDDGLFPAGEIGEDLEDLIEQANEGMDISGEPEESAWDEEVVDEDEVIDLTEVAEVLIRQGLQTGSFADRAEDLGKKESDASDMHQASPEDIVGRLEDELPAAFIPVGTVEKEDGAVRGFGEAAAGLTITDDAVEKALENVIREMFAEKIERILVNAVKKVVEEDIERLKKQILDNIESEPGE